MESTFVETALLIDMKIGLYQQGNIFNGRFQSFSLTTLFCINKVISSENVE